MIIAPKLLANDYYLHCVSYLEKISVYPGDKINAHYIYDVRYLEHPGNLTEIAYISTQKETLLSQESVIAQKNNTPNNFMDKIRKNPEVIICTEKSLSALFFYYKRFRQRISHTPIIIIQSNHLLPFYAVPSKIMLPKLPSHMIAAVPYFEDLNIPSRLASTNLELPGWYKGNSLSLLSDGYAQILSI